MLSFVLSENSSQVIKITEELKKSNRDDVATNAVKLKSDSIKRFTELREQIVRTAEEIETSYRAEITNTEKSILGEVERSFVGKSEFGDYKSGVETSIQQTADEIELVSTNIEEVSTDLENFKTASRSEITTTADAIVSKAEELYETKSESADLESRVLSEITQTSQNITENFSRELSVMSDDLSTIGGSVSDLINDLDVYIRRGELENGVYGIEIGRSDSNIKARFTNERLSFYQGASEVAYISGSSLYITNADVLDYLRIGNSAEGYFLFDTTSNGLEVRWIDAE